MWTGVNAKKTATRTRGYSLLEAAQRFMPLSVA